MERAGFGRRAGWVLMAGLVLGSLLMPRVADAVGSLVTIQDGGSSTSKAGVTKANQLQTAETAPSAFRVFIHSMGASGTCEPFATAVPTTKGFVVKSVVVNITDPSSAGLTLFAVFPNGTCSGQPLISAPTQVAADYSIPIEPGFAIAPGHRMSMELPPSGAEGSVEVYGYLVPPGDVPSTTVISL